MGKTETKGKDFDHMVMLMWWWVGLKAVVVMLGCGAQSPSQLGHNILIMIIKLIWPFPVRSISSPPVASGWWSISFLFVCTAQVGSCNCIDWEIHAMCANLQEASFYYILSVLRFNVKCSHLDIRPSDNLLFKKLFFMRMWIRFLRSSKYTCVWV